MTIAITGVTGELGRLVVSKLTEKVSSSDVIGIARNVAKAKDLEIPIREADYNDVAALEKALNGVDTLLLISSNEIGKRVAQHTNAIESAKKAGVKKIVYTSVLRADTSTLVLAPEHVATEKAIKESGLEYTILRNGWYTENYSNRVAAAPKVGSLSGSAGDGKASPATREDYAEAAVAVLTGEGHNHKVYELAGDGSFTLTELAAEISKNTKKEIPYKDIPEKEFASLLSQHGLPEDFAGVIASFDVSTSKGDLFDDGHELAKLIGHPTTPFEKSVDIFLKQN